MEGAGFLFVNEDPTSSGTKRPSRSVNRHAQLSTIAKRRAQLPPSTAPRGWKSVSCVHDATTRGSSRGHANQDLGSNAYKSQPQCRNEVTEADEPTKYDVVRDSAIALAVTRRARGLSIPKSVTGNLQSWKYVVLDYYVRFWTRKHSDVAEDEQLLVQQAINDRVQGCLAMEVHMYALASAVAAHMKWITKTTALSGEGTNMPPEAFLQRAIRALREYFSSVPIGFEVDQQILIDMMDLFRAEYFARRTNTGKHHVWIFDSLIDRQVNPRPEIPQVEDSWNMCVVIQSLYNCSPRLLAESYDLQQERKHESEVGEWHNSTVIGTGFHAARNLFTSEMLALIDEVVRYAKQTSFRAWQLTFDDCTEGEDLIYRLLWIPSPQPTMKFGNKRPCLMLDCKMSCVRFALILWLLLTTSHLSFQESSLFLLPRLEHNLLLVMDGVRTNRNNISSAEKDLFLWVASVGISISKITKMGNKQGNFDAVCSYFRSSSSTDDLSANVELQERFLPLRDGRRGVEPTESREHGMAAVRLSGDPVLALMEEATKNKNKLVASLASNQGNGRH